MTADKFRRYFTTVKKSPVGVLCGCSKVSVYESIDVVRKKFLKFFANYPNE
ncbi:hypothetical protein CLONEX_01074 [[Clostridium] nexile DSM 1787]|nr:hypothetical protein CLONEX_01074 [[Clostridium] nexile DSM 1787]